MANHEEYICPICRQEYDPPIYLTARIKCGCGAEADTNIIIEFNKALSFLRSWREAFCERVFMRPEPERLDWFVKLTKDSNRFTDEKEA